MSTRIAIIDKTVRHRPPEGFLDGLMHALHEQLADFRTAWGLRARVALVNNAAELDCPLVLMDDADQAGALGYHWTDPVGRAYGRGFAGTVLENGGTWSEGPNSVSGVVSHELLEMVLDLEANEFAFDGHRRMWAKEACDAVEMSSYTVGGVAVSNFVLPPYFTPGAPGGYDRLGILSAPFTIAKGGYAIVSMATSETALYGWHEERAVPVIRDPQGTMSLAIDAAYPEWRRAIKSDAGARTMRRLTLGQP